MSQKLEMSQKLGMTHRLMEVSHSVVVSDGLDVMTSRTSGSGASCVCVDCGVTLSHVSSGLEGSKVAERWLEGSTIPHMGC